MNWVAEMCVQVTQFNYCLYSYLKILTYLKIARYFFAWQEWAPVSSSTGKLEKNLKNLHIHVEYYRYMA